MRKSKRKEKVATHRPPILPTPLVLPPSEEDEVVDTKLMVFRAQEGDPDPPTEVGVRHGVSKVWVCHIFLEKIMTTHHLEWEEVGIKSLRNTPGSLGPDTA